MNEGRDEDPVEQGLYTGPTLHHWDGNYEAYCRANQGVGASVLIIGCCDAGSVQMYMRGIANAFFRDKEMLPHRDRDAIEAQLKAVEWFERCVVGKGGYAGSFAATVYRRGDLFGVGAPKPVPPTPPPLEFTPNAEIYGAFDHVAGF